MTSLFKPYFEELGLQIPERPIHLGAKFEEQIEAIFEAKPDAFSFVFGIPSVEVLEKCKSLGIKTVSAATTADTTDGGLVSNVTLVKKLP